MPNIDEPTPESEAQATKPSLDRRSMLRLGGMAAAAGVAGVAIADVVTASPAEAAGSVLSVDNFLPDGAGNVQITALTTSAGNSLDRIDVANRTGALGVSLPILPGTGVSIINDTHNNGTPFINAIAGLQIDTVVQDGESVNGLYAAVEAWAETHDDGAHNVVGAQLNAIAHKDRETDLTAAEIWGATLGAHIQPSVTERPPIAIGAEFDLSDLSGTGEANPGTGVDIVAHGYNDFVNGLMVRGDTGSSGVFGGHGGTSSLFEQAITIPTTQIGVGKIYPDWDAGVDYDIGSTVVSPSGSGSAYKCIAATHSSSTPPPGDATHWVAYTPTITHRGPRKYAFWYGPLVAQNRGTPGTELFSVDVSGNIVSAGRTVARPLVRTITATSDVIPVSATIVELNNTSGASKTLASAPTLAAGANGQLLTIFNSSVQNVVLQDQGTLAGSNLRLGAATRTLGPRDSIQLMYSSTIGDWIELSFSNVL